MLRRRATGLSLADRPVPRTPGPSARGCSSRVSRPLGLFGLRVSGSRLPGRTAGTVVGSKSLASPTGFRVTSLPGKLLCNGFFSPASERGF